MIKPTIGRQVWLWRLGADITKQQPEAATVVYVHNDRKVNLQVLDHQGMPRRMLEVPLRQAEDAVPDAKVAAFAEWMPFQIGQAKALEPQR